MRYARVPAVIITVLAIAFGSLWLSTPAASAYVDDSTPANGWRPNGGTAYALARNGDTVIIGGTFTSMVSATGSTATRNRLAAISALTGALLPWAPNPNGEVRALAISADGQTVYVGGTFTSIGGASRANLAAVSATNGQATSFTADTNATVHALVLHEDSLFVGGIFWRVRNTNRGGGAELNPSTGALRAWNPRTNYGTYAIEPALDGSGIFIGGPFTSVDGQPQNHLAKVAGGTGNALPWLSGSTCQDALNPCVVYALQADGNDLFAAMGGPGGRVATLAASTGQQKWWTGGDGDIQTVIVDGAKVYAGGHFAATMNGVPRAGLVALDRYTGAVLDELDSQVLGGTGVWSILMDGDRLRFAGQFSTTGGTSIARYSSFPVVPDPPDTTPPGAPGSLRAPAPLANGVTLTWTASSDNVATVEYRVSRNGIPVGTTAVTTFKDFGVAPSTSYVYGIAAVDGAGNVGPTRTVSVTTEAASPTLLPRQASWRYFSRGTLPAENWFASSYNDASWSEGVGEFGFGEGDEQTYISPLGVAHYFRTTFDNPAGTTVQSARIRMVVDDGAVVYLNGTEIGRYNMPSGAVSQATLATAGIGGVTEMTYQSLTIPVSALRTGSNVLAVEVHNNSANSSDISFDAFVPFVGTAAPAAPEAPTGLSGVGTQTTIALSWNASAGATSYVVRRDGDIVATPTSTGWTDTGLTSGTRYTYTVAARNAVGTGTESGSVAVMTTSGPAVPAAPANLAGDPTKTTISLTWDPADGAISYVVTRDGVEVSTSTGTSFADEGLEPGTRYTYRVAGINAVGTGPLSTQLDVTTIPEPPVDSPAPSVGTTTGTSIALSWAPVATATSYEVTRNGTALPAFSATTLVDSGLVPNTSYEYTVTARNAGGSGPTSAPITATTTSTPVAAYAVSGDSWRYLDSGTDLGTGWRQATYNDTTWKTGPTQAGYGDGDEQTTLVWGSDPNRKPVTVYARRSFDAGGSVSDVTGMTLRLLVDDGAVVYLNGTELTRFNLPTGTITSTTRATRAIAGAEESQWRTYALPRTALNSGSNTIAVEVHNDAPSSSDVSFDLELRPAR